MVAGHAGSGGAPGDFAVLRYRPNGTLDTSFAGDGIQTTDFVGAYDSATAIALQADGRIVAVGGTWPAASGHWLLARYEGNPQAANTSPTARLAFSCTRTVCYFDGRGSTDADGAIAGYRWDFGDGASASGSYVRKTFARYGTYTVSLTVTDNAGAAATRAASVTLRRLKVRGYTGRAPDARAVVERRPRHELDRGIALTGGSRWSTRARSSTGPKPDQTRTPTPSARPQAPRARARTRCASEGPHEPHHTTRIQVIEPGHQRHLASPPPAHGHIDEPTFNV